TPNVQPLTDIANIGHVSSKNQRQTLDTLLLTQVMASNLNSYQTPQVRRCRGRPRRKDKQRDKNSGAPYTFQLKGQNHHKIGTLLPTHEDGRPSQHNPLVQAFRMARDRVSVASMQPFTLRLIGTRQRNARQYNLPTASEVATLVPGDGNPMDSRDVVVEERGGEEGRTSVKRISELHPSFMALQYPLLFPYGEDGCHKVDWENVHYYCKECKKNVTNPRQTYKLVITIGTTDGEEINYVLFNTIASQLLGYTVEELLTKSIKEVG
nr:hypothetical protein [Tanacetum cinerariifolium]